MIVMATMDGWRAACRQSFTCHFNPGEAPQIIFADEFLQRCLPWMIKWKKERKPRGGDVRGC